MAWEAQTRCTRPPICRILTASSGIEPWPWGSSSLPSLTELRYGHSVARVHRSSLTCSGGFGARTLIAVASLLFAAAPLTGNTSPRRACVRACSRLLADCDTSHPKARARKHCRAAIVRNCRRHGLTTCEPPPTTTTLTEPVASSTTLAPSASSTTSTTTTVPAGSTTSTMTVTTSTTTVPCKAAAQACVTQDACCSGACSSGFCVCFAGGEGCGFNAQCCSNFCNGQNDVCDCFAAGQPCYFGPQSCCAGSVCDPTATCCSLGNCMSDADCCSNSCTSGSCTCIADGGGCFDDRECCSTGFGCNNNVCGACKPSGTACDGDIFCCSKACSYPRPGTCR